MDTRISLIALASALISTAASAQMTNPFTYDELYSVFRRVAPDSQAQEMARSALAETARGAEHVGAGIVFRSTSHVTLSDDTLILLSLLSEETNAKVRAFRSTLRAGQPESAAEAAEWEKRRAELKAWADEGYPGAEP